MNDSTYRRPAPVRRALQASLLGLAALPLVAACGGSAPSAEGVNPAGSLLENPSSGFLVIVDDSTAGNASQLGLVKVGWGRLVDVFSEEASGDELLVMRDFLVNPNLITSGNYTLETQTLTGRDRLVIRRPKDDPDFRNLAIQAGNGLSPIQDVGFGGSGFFNMVPRNAAIQVQFDDLLLQSSIAPNTVKLLTGLPPITPQEVRLMADPNYGDLIDKDGDGTPEFYPSRVLLDLAISEFESFAANPPLSPNNLGTPPSFDTNQSNLQLRIPTEENSILGQDQIIRNLTDHGLETSLSGTIDFGSPTLDVVRNVRSGGPSNLTGDPYNGFLRDDVAPRIVGRFDGDITSTPIPDGNFPGDETRYIIPTANFTSATCAQQLVDGDVVRQGEVIAQVTGTSTAPFGGDIGSIPVQLLAWPEIWGDTPDEWPGSSVGSVEYLSAWDPIADVDQQGCFLDIFPTPQNVALSPTSDIFTNSSFGLRFNEPMAAESIEAFETMRLTRRDPSDPDLSSYENVVGTVGSSLDLLEYRLQPLLPLAHEAGQQEAYFFTLGEGLAGPTDLAGNPLQSTLPTVSTSLWSGNAVQVNSGRVTLFNGPDEDLEQAAVDDTFLWAEWGGEHVYLPQLGAIQPRPLTRFMGIAAREQVNQVGANEALSGDVMINSMTPTAGTTEPLNPLGSRLQAIWRFHDLGLPLQDFSTFQPIWTLNNIDVEGLRWAPLGGGVVVDNYSQFEMRMAHASSMPDEVLNPMTQLPVFPQSGMQGAFDDNLLSAIEDPYRIVHERALGYTVNPGDVQLVGTTTILMPWPMNRTLPPSQHRYYTYRDTTIQTRGGESNNGSYGAQWHTVTGNPQPLWTLAMPCDVANPLHTVGQIQSIAMPLLMEFRCYPDDAGIGVNLFDTSLAITTSTQPYFRAFSSGGTDTQLQNIVRDPDLETLANGGFDPASLPLPGVTLFGRDQQVYLGAADFVIRTSRSHSVWWPVVDKLGNSTFDGGQITSAVFSEPVVEPRPENQPDGTSITFDFRGASSLLDHGPVAMDGATGDTVVNDDAFWCRQAANQLDPYGDAYDPQANVSECDGSVNYNLLDFAGEVQVNRPVTFLDGDDTWKPTAGSIDGATFYQVRVTFVSNAETGLSPLLSAFGMTYRQN